MSIAQLNEVIELLSSQEMPDNPTVQDSRDGFERLARHVGGDTNAVVEKVDAGGVPAEMVTADDTPADRTILYLHGGGYVIGSPATHRELASRISRDAGAHVLVIDYRLAPESPFPAPVEDAVTAYRWLLERGSRPEELIVAGDSAGGGLTVATLVSLRDQGIPLPSCGVCLSPWVDMEGVGDSMSSRAHLDPMVQRDGLVAMAGVYLGEAGPRSPLAAPLYADLEGLPPLLVQVGERETLYDDATRLVKRAEDAGVVVEFQSWDDMVHVWHLFAPILDEGQEAIEHIGRFVKEHSKVAVG